MTHDCGDLFGKGNRQARTIANKLDRDSNVQVTKGDELGTEDITETVASCIGIVEIVAGR